MATASVSVWRLEAIAAAGELGLQRLEILDDAVMDHGDAARGDGMGVALARHAMRRPARVADADPALHRLGREPRLELGELALGAAALDRAVDQGRDAAPNHSRDIRGAAARR